MVERWLTWKRPHLFEAARPVADAVLRHAVLIFLIAGGLVAMPHISPAAEAIGIDGSASQVVFSLLFAAFVLAARRWLQFEVDRLSLAERFREAGAIQAALRRYIPEVVARQLESGRELGRSECEITVLFADMRGFTSFCESHTPVEIFTMVNWFTDRLCQIVRRHGGDVVAFNGDGITALFGQSNALADKERAAVRAGLAIVAAMKSYSPPLQARSEVLSVGVGIATGTDFVGNIRVSDHTIWTAIGNTTNLAARLQDLCRELSAAMVIDGPTRAALGETGAALEYRNVPIRGRRDLEDVYVLH
jgi:class 3 adenylate cyclase